jgi:predicted ATPase/DNA-binding SARP family transcriptional activator/DNA-binding CsgD family transcriptional regulator
LEVALLGGLAVRRGGQPLVGFRSRKAAALLAYLAATGRPHARTHLAALLWGELPDAAARAALRAALANLRALVGPHLVAGRDRAAFVTGANGGAGTGAWVDVPAFEALLADPPPAEAGGVDRLRAAVALYGGDFLAGVDVPDAPTFEEWAALERERLRQLAVRALRRLAAGAAAGGDPDGAVEALRRALALEPWLEEAHRELMAVLAGAGRRSEALAQYAACRRALAEELGVEPDAETAALAERVRAGLIERAPDAAPGTPPAPSPARVPSNLPAPPTPLIGREREAAALADLLCQEDLRLVTLTGAGGCGKTRLALHVAADLRDRRGQAGRSGPAPSFPDGVWLVELAPLADPALVPQAVAAALGVRVASGAAPTERLVAALRERALLLVLDNCEHLLEACAPLVGRLLAGCPALRVLATSREPLQIAGECQRPVPPLAAPDPGRPGGPWAPAELADYPAVRLFVARAQAVAPGFALTPGNAGAVAEVCARLAGLPLALELAAARAGVLSVAQIAARLDDCLRLLTGGSRAGPTRQQTLRGTLDWSHDLLTEPARAAFRRLSVFAGGFDLAAAEAVCGGGAPASAAALDAPDGLPALAALDALEALTDLVHQSLVVVEPNPPGAPGGLGSGPDGGGAVRYRLLEPVRQYAAEHLAASGEEAAVRAQHAAHFLGLAGLARAQRRAPDSLLSLLAPHLDNLWAALRWLEQRGDVAGGAGRPGPVAGRPGRLRAALGWWVALFAYAAGDYAQARALGEASLAVWRALGDPEGTAQALSHLGIYVRELGDYARAQALLEEGLALYRTLGAPGAPPPPETAHTLLRLGEVFQAQGDVGRARACYEEARALLEAAGERPVRLPHHLGGLALDEGRYAAAGAWFRESLALQRAQGLREWVPSSLADLAGLAAAEGDAARALRLAGAAERAAEEAGATLQPTERARLDRWLAGARRALGPTAAEAARAAGRDLSVDEAVTEALAAPAPEAAEARRPAPAGRAAILTPREREVAALLAAGCHSDRQLAARLTIEPSTAGVHVQRILEKLGLRSRWQVATWATEHGLGATPAP